jgi:beta-N-acetylhexosaminidase
MKVKKTSNPWVETTLQRLTAAERIAQLLHIPAWSDKGPEHEAEVEALVKKYSPGGIIFFQGTARRQAELSNRYQAVAKVPMLLSIDGEWGLAMRLKDTQAFPYQLTLGALQHDNLIYEMGRAIGRQCRRIGLHINFAPTVDINTEPANPVIGFRSFGSDPERVAQKGVAYLRGLQAEGVMAVAKHFPGHGDTQLDSHLALPQVLHSRERLESLEYAPFRAAIAAEVGGVMVAHLAVPALEPTAQLPASLSKRVVTGELREKLGYKGLIFSDALNMKGATGSYAPGEGDVKALLAGHDALLYVEDVPAAIRSIQEAVARGLISQAEIDRRCRKVLHTKYEAGLARYQAVELAGIEADLHKPEDQALIQRIYEQALTCLGPDPDFHPARKAGNWKLVALGEGGAAFWAGTEWAEQGDFLSTAAVASELTLEPGDQLLLSLHGLSQKAGNQYGLKEEILEKLRFFLQTYPCLLILPANPYLLQKIPYQHARQVLITYEENVDTKQKVHAYLRGEIPASGVLPIRLEG